jgi:hypothetical protein
MPYDSNGVFTLNAGYLAVAGQVIQPSQHNPPLEDIVAAGLSNVLVRDGRAPMTGNLNMGGFKLTSVLAGTSALDGVNKTQLDLQSVKYATKSTNYTALAADAGTVTRFTASATLSLTPAATLGASWNYMVIADGGDVTIDPNGAETIDGGATLVVPNGSSTFIICSGSAFFSDKLAIKATQGHIYGLSLANNGVDAANDIDIAIGSATSDSAAPTLMTLAASLTKRIDANWTVGTNQGGLDTGSVADGTYWVWLIQRSDTGVVDALFSASATAPTMPSGYDRKRRIAPIIRASATILAFSYNSFSKFWEFSVSSTDTSTISTTAALRTVKVPFGVPVMARFGVAVANTSTGLMSIVNHWNPALGSSLPNGRSGVGHVFVNTNTSQSMQFGFDAVSNASSQLYNLMTHTGGSTLTSYSLTTLGYYFTPGS